MTANAHQNVPWPQANNPANMLAYPTVADAWLVMKIPLEYAAKLPLSTAWPRLCNAKLPWPHSPQTIISWYTLKPDGELLLKRRIKNKVSKPSKSGSAIPTRRYETMMTGICSCVLNWAYWQITPPPAAAVRAAIRGSCVVGVSTLTSGDSELDKDIRNSNTSYHGHGGIDPPQNVDGGSPAMAPILHDGKGNHLYDRRESDRNTS